MWKSAQQSYTLFRNVYPHFLHLLSNLGLYKRLARKAAKHAFANRDNQRKKGHTFCMVVNQITFTNIHWHKVTFSKHVLGKSAYYAIHFVLLQNVCAYVNLWEGMKSFLQQHTTRPDIQSTFWKMIPPTVLHFPISHTVNHRSEHTKALMAPIFSPVSRGDEWPKMASFIQLWAILKTQMLLIHLIPIAECHF